MPKNTPIDDELNSFKDMSSYFNELKGEHAEFLNAMGFQKNLETEINSIINSRSQNYTELIKQAISSGQSIKDLATDWAVEQDFILAALSGNTAEMDKLLPQYEKVVEKQKIQRDLAKAMTDELEKQKKIEEEYGGWLKNITGTVESLIDTADAAFKNPLVAAGILFKGLQQVGERYWNMTLSASKELNVSLETSSKMMWDSANAAGLGLYRTEDLLKATVSLNKELQGNLDISEQLRDTTAEISMGWHMAEGDSARLLVTMKNLSGATEQSARGAFVIAKSLGDAYKVNPASAMKQIAANSEASSLYTKGMGENLIKGAIAAGKLGVEFSSILNAAKGLLDFERSINAEMEASVLMNKTINLERARALSYQGDMVGVAAELSKQFGDISKMDPFAKQAAADAANMSVEQLSTMLNNYKKYGSELNSLSKENASAVLSGNEEIAKSLDKTAKFFDTIKNAVKDWGLVVFGGLALGLPLLSATLGTASGLLGKFGGLVGGISTKLNSSIGGALSGPMKSFGSGIRVLLTGIAQGLTAFGTAMMGPGGIGLAALTGAMIGLGYALNLAAPGIKAVFSGLGDFFKTISTIDAGNLLAVSSTLGVLGMSGTLLAIGAPGFMLSGLGLMSLAAGLAAVAPLLHVAEALGLAKPGYSHRGSTGDKSENQSILEALNRIEQAITKGGDVYLDKDKVGKSLSIWQSNSRTNLSTGTNKGV